MTKHLRLFAALLTCAVTLAASAGWAAERVIVFGGSGQLGSQVARALTARGHEVSVFVRPSSKLDRLEGVKVTRVEGDVLKEDDVAKALKAGKYTAVVDALARGTADASFYDVSERHISKWAREAGVRQIILHSSVGAGESRKIYPPQQLSRMQAVLDAKEAGEKHVMASGVTYTIIRNAVLRDGAPGATEKAELFEDQAKFGAVTRQGLARLTADCLGNAKCSNKIFHAVDAGVKFDMSGRE
jgi:uncharacterized protein YbjT (DUF2867 family)